MLLQIKDSSELVKLADMQQLIDPNLDTVQGQKQQGQEEQPVDSFKKENLVFPSGENLPRCWLDVNYKTA